MTRDELLQEITAIGAIEDGAERRNRLTALSDEVRTVCEANETLTATNNTLTENNKKLQEYNMELFLRVGKQQNTPKAEPAPEEGSGLSYENLFNEKGELK